MPDWYFFLIGLKVIVTIGQLTLRFWNGIQEEIFYIFQVSEGIAKDADANRCFSWFSDWTANW